MSVNEAIVVLANRKLAERELQTGPVDLPERWLSAVIGGIRKDHAGRIATMPDGLTLADQVNWIEHGPPAQGARIPPPEHPVVVHDQLPPETFKSCLEAAREALGPVNITPRAESITMGMEYDKTHPYPDSVHQRGIARVQEIIKRDPERAARFEEVPHFIPLRYNERGEVAEYTIIEREEWDNGRPRPATGDT